MPVLTISRQPGSLGDEIAVALSSKLGWQLITRQKILDDFLKPLADDEQFNLLSQSSKFYREKGSNGLTFLETATNKLFEISEKEPLIIVGFGSQIIFENHPDSLHLRIIAPDANRVERLKQQFRIAYPDAENIMKTSDRKQKRYISNVFGKDLCDCSLYDIILNTGKLGVDDCVSAVMGLCASRESSRAIARSAEDEKVIANKSDRFGFKNPAEIEFARILDMYQIEWRYEPKTFPIEWDPEGNVILAFSPDFYLPKFDTYLELTTMNQKYVTMKNKKARKLRELYPGINVKIVYKKDFLSLIERFRGQEG